MPRFMKNVQIISRCAIQFRGEKLASHGLNGCHVDYILNICRTPGISQDMLAQTIHVNSSNVTRQLAVLEESGFVERRQSAADKRVTEVYPTKHALEVLPSVRAVLQEWNALITEDLTEEETAQFVSLLEKVARKADACVSGRKADG